MATITKKELIDSIAEKTGITQSRIKPIVQQFLDEITAELAKGNRLESKEQAARAAHNPKTLERIEVPAKRKVKFKVGRIMREGMNAKGAKK